jgi:hypothetical protein
MYSCVCIYVCMHVSHICTTIQQSGATGQNSSGKFEYVMQQSNLTWNLYRTVHVTLCFFCFLIYKHVRNNT